MNKLPLIALSLLAAGTASAQDADWTYKATLYGWFPGLTTTIDTRFGTVESDRSATFALYGEGSVGVRMTANQS